MEPFKKILSIVTPFDKVNVDTDQIVPKQFLKLVQKTGFGKFLFYNWRYDKGEKPVSDFVLNDVRYQNSHILVTGENFGCGSSREHAVWALKDFGFGAIIAPSFADIFYSNCFKNGMLPIILPEEQVEILMNDAEKGSNARMEVDLEAQTITSSDGSVFSFDVDPFKKHCLLNGLDDIGLTMEKSSSIEAFEKKLEIERPWL